MAKLYTMLTFLIATILLFNAAGIMTSTGYLMNTLGITNPENFGTSTFYLALASIIIIGVAGIIIGSFIMNFATNSWQVNASVTLVPIFFLILMDILSIFTKVAQANRFIALIVLVPMLVCFSVAIHDWWRGFQ